MRPTFDGQICRAPCPDCGGAVTNFVPTRGSIHFERSHSFKNEGFRNVSYLVLQCGGCDRGGLAVLHHNGRVEHGRLGEFYPPAVEIGAVPPGAPGGVIAEYREAEVCASAGAWRAASALLRSALEKTLAANGYTNGTLYARIEAAARDGLITAPLKRRAHDNVRDLGNDVVHDDWREVTPDEYDSAHHYVQRIVEAFYDHREEVEALLRQAKRLP